MVRLIKALHFLDNLAGSYFFVFFDNNKKSISKYIYTFTDFIYIFLFGIRVNTGLSFPTFGKEKKGNLFTEAIL